MNLLADALRLAFWLWSGEEKGHAQLEEEGREGQGKGQEYEMSVLSVPSSEEVMRLQFALDNSERTVGELRAVVTHLQQTILAQEQQLLDLGQDMGDDEDEEEASIPPPPPPLPELSLPPPPLPDLPVSEGRLTVGAMTEQLGHPWGTVQQLEQRLQQQEVALQGKEQRLQQLEETKQQQEQRLQKQEVALQGKEQQLQQQEVALQGKEQQLLEVELAVLSAKLQSRI